MRRCRSRSSASAGATRRGKPSFALYGVGDACLEVGHCLLEVPLAGIADVGNLPHRGERSRRAQTREQLCSPEAIRWFAEQRLHTCETTLEVVGYDQGELMADMVDSKRGGVLPQLVRRSNPVARHNPEDLERVGVSELSVNDRSEKEACLVWIAVADGLDRFRPHIRVLQCESRELLADCESMLIRVPERPHARGCGPNAERICELAARGLIGLRLET